MTLSQKESASRFQFLKPCFTGNNISTNDTSSFENTPFTCLHQGDGNAENELQRLKLDIVGRRPENCRAVENEARELQNQHLSQGLKNLEHQPSDKQISISKYPIHGPCIKCMEKSCNRACKYTTYRIRVQSVPHTGDLRMYEHSHEPFSHLVQWDRTCKHMESLSNMFGNILKH